jgi:RND family efflux transporter MFP subunit
MLRSFNLAGVMLLMLSIGVGVGTSISMFNGPDESRITAAERRQYVAQGASPGTTFASGASAVGAKDVPEPDTRDEYVGVVFSRQSADIVARSEGRVEELYVRLGEALKTGDVIARIEPTLILRELEMAKASLRSVQAQERAADVALEDAESRHARRKSLWESGLVSREDFAAAGLQAERAATDVELARARVAEQMVRVQQIQESLDHTTIKANFDGTVAATYLDAGATVRSGTPIVGMMRSSDLWVRFAVPESRQRRVPIGSAIRFSIEGPNVVVPAVIEHVSPGVAAIAQDLVVEARLQIPAALSGQIKAGASGLASLGRRP